MKFHLNFTPEPFTEPVKHDHRILLLGSCFAEGIGDRLARLKFRTFQNPHGIIYDPYSITNSIVASIDNKPLRNSDLTLINGIWHSWDHHGSFSGPNIDAVTARINQVQGQAHEFLKNAEWVFVTLGSSFSYQLETDLRPVANCHKAPSSLFHKRMLTVEEIKSSLDTCVHRLFHFNPSVKIIFTVSPVRYVRDGLVNNNLSKARLIEVVQHLVSKFSGLHYFPAYEIVNDVLRDYRFFKEDMVHPTDQAIDYVFEAFSQAAFDAATLGLVSEIGKIQSSLEHRPLHPGTDAEHKFRQKLKEDILALQDRYTYIRFDIPW